MKIVICCCQRAKIQKKNLYLFLSGLCRYKCGEKEAGKKEMDRAIKIYEWLGCDNLARNYRDDLKKYTE